MPHLIEIGDEICRQKDKHEMSIMWSFYAIRAKNTQDIYE